MNKKPIYILVLFIFNCLLSINANTITNTNNSKFPPLVRLHAYADVTRIKLGKYRVTLNLEVQNDDKKYPVVIESISAEAWRGTTKIKLAEDWLQPQNQVLIMQSTKLNIIKRSFYVNKEPPNNYWIRWLRFTAKTNRGHFISNLVATPYSYNVTQQ